MVDSKDIHVVEGWIHRQVSTRIKKTERQRGNLSVALPTLYQQRKAQADRIVCVCVVCVYKLCLHARVAPCSSVAHVLNVSIWVWEGCC